MKEVWKPIKEFEGKYEVSNFGKVRSIDRLVKGTNGKVQRRKGMTKTQKHDKDGYLVVNLYTPKGNRPKKVHRLVANAFIDNPNNKPEINHIDGNKENNHANNLEWTTRAENMKHFSISGLSRSGEKTCIFKTHE